MGNDLLLSALAIPKGKVPDWDAAHSRVAQMAEADLTSALEEWQGEAPCDDEGEVDLAECRHELDRLIDLVKGATESEHRHLWSVEDWPVPGWTVWFTGGDSWGDSPSEEFDYFNAFINAGLAEAAGFGRQKGDS